MFGEQDIFLCYVKKFIKFFDHQIHKSARLIDLLNQLSELREGSLKQTSIIAKLG